MGRVDQDAGPAAGSHGDAESAPGDQSRCQKMAVATDARPVVRPLAGDLGAALARRVLPPSRLPLRPAVPREQSSSADDTGYPAEAVRIDSLQAIPARGAERAARVRRR